jgi:hypothetical protein
MTGVSKPCSELYFIVCSDTPEFHLRWRFAVKIHLPHSDNVPDVYVKFPTVEPYALLTNFSGSTFHTFFENLACCVRWNAVNHDWSSKHLRLYPLWFICLPSPYLHQLSLCSQSLTSTAVPISLRHTRKIFPVCRDLSIRKPYCAIKSYRRADPAFDEKFPQG